MCRRLHEFRRCVESSRAEPWEWTALPPTSNPTLSPPCEPIRPQLPGLAKGAMTWFMPYSEHVLHLQQQSAVQALFCGSFPDSWKRLLPVSGGWCVIVCPHPVSCRKSHFTFPHFVSVFLVWNMCFTSPTWPCAVSHDVKSTVLFFMWLKLNEEIYHFL